VIEVLVCAAIAVLLLLVVEIGRWTFRPAARRLRMIKKIGGRQ
jgi:hypothetical protein